jgi:hypothetical protein
MSQDTLLLLVTTGTHLAYIVHPTIHILPVIGAGFPLNPLLFLLAAVYWIADALFVTRPRARHWVKIGVLSSLVGLVTILPLVATTILRAQTEPHRYTHDGLIQVEAAMEFLVQGKNPYAVSYRNTAMADWPFEVPGVPENPALEHIAYLPATFVLPLPFYLPVDRWIGWYDHRWFHLLFFLIWWMTAKDLVSHQDWLNLTIVVGLSPLLLPYFIEGRNDLLILSWLTLATWALKKEHVALSASFLALACVTKPTAWFAVPSYLVFLFCQPRFRSKRLHALIALCGVGVIFVLPFFLWSPAAFIDDVFLYLTGQGAQPYPITGYSLGNLLLSLGVIRSPFSQFPFGLLQLGVGIVTLWFMYRYVKRRPSLGRMWLGFGLLLMAVSFAGRFFNDSHLGFVGIVLAQGYLLEREL